MAYTYTYVPNGNLESGKPARATDMRAIRDMAPAIAEGADGAPRVQWEAMGASPLLGVGSVGGADPIAFTSIGDCRVFRLEIYTGAPSGNHTLQISTSTDNGANWSAYSAISATLNSAQRVFIMMIDLGSGAYSYRAIVFNLSTPQMSSTIDSGSFTAAPAANAFRIRANNGSGLNVMAFKVGRG